MSNPNAPNVPNAPTDETDPPVETEVIEATEAIGIEIEADVNLSTEKIEISRISLLKNITLKKERAHIPLCSFYFSPIRDSVGGA
jgi:hypothetical protein